MDDAAFRRVVEAELEDAGMDWLLYGDAAHCFVLARAGEDTSVADAVVAHLPGRTRRLGDGTRASVHKRFPGSPDVPGTDGPGFYALVRGVGQRQRALAERAAARDDE